MARQPGDSDFSNVNVSGVIKVNGTQVVGTQGPAITNAAPATTANLIIAVLRNHGLIAT